jgi:hypothetical protein
VARLNGRLHGRVEALERRVGEARPCPGPHPVVIIFGPGQEFESPDDVPECGCPEDRVRIFLPAKKIQK